MKKVFPRQATVVSIAGVALVLAGIAALACLLPALDASRTDPANVLHEG